MLLTPRAAMEVCSRAAETSRVVVRIEGGIWREGQFEARIDGPWDGANPPVSPEHMKANNAAALREIEAEQSRHNAFVITTAFDWGYLHIMERNAI